MEREEVKSVQICILTSESKYEIQKKIRIIALL